MRLSWLISLFLIAVVLGPTGLWAAPLVRLDDPVGDDHGPGGYLYPSDGTLYRRGSFDLRRFEIEVDGDMVLFHVTVGEPIRRPNVAKSSNASEIRLENNLYIQNIDIYIDTEAGQGFTETIPGRNVDFEPDAAWDVAVVLTPQPFAARSMLDDWKPVRHVIFPVNVRANGSQLTARVPLHELGSLPKPHWGYQVLLSGATWGASFDVVNRYALGQPINVFTIPVTTVPETDKFGGGELSFVHPYVLDLLAPEGQTQEKILSAYDEATKRRALVPMVYPNPAAHAALVGAKPADATKAPQRPSSVLLTVKSVDGDQVILERKDLAPVEAYQMGVVLDGDRELGRVVVTSVHPAFVLTTAVEGQAELRPGFSVRFTVKPAAP